MNEDEFANARVHTADNYKKKYDEEMEWIRQVILVNGKLNRIMEENINILLSDNKELRDKLEIEGRRKQKLIYEIAELENTLARKKYETAELKKTLGKKEHEIAELGKTLEKKEHENSG